MVRPRSSISSGVMFFRASRETTGCRGLTVTTSASPCRPEEMTRKVATIARGSNTYLVKAAVILIISNPLSPEREDPPLNL
ncbi:MAG TPA: hypothetical protein PLJ30_11530 [Deltaproteobacteria bacterium]|nr:hypothetical protein [Deltaproteobacteria bacterium]